MQAGDVVTPAAVQLGDPGYTRWTQAALHGHLTSALRALSLLRPDAVAEVREVALVAGAAQTLPDDTTRYLGPVRNLGATGTAPGDVIAAGDMQVLDAFHPGWMSEAPQAAIQEVLFDYTTPRRFYVYPPAPDPDTDEALHIAIRVARAVAPISADADELPVDDSYYTPLLHWTLAYAYAENSDVGSKQLSAQYTQLARQAIGLKTERDVNAPPANKSDES